VFHPDDPRDYSKFVEQREELRRAVFDDEYIKDRDKYVTFTSDLGKLAEEQSMAPLPQTQNSKQSTPVNSPHQ
jgi:hypothetical protein